MGGGSWGMGMGMDMGVAGYVRADDERDDVSEQANQPNEPTEPAPADIADAPANPRPDVDTSGSEDDHTDAMGIDDSDPIDATLVGKPVEEREDSGPTPEKPKREDGSS